MSFSFGRSAIFLCGGGTKKTKPIALLLRSGDVLIMTQEAREKFHAVPRIIDDQLIKALENQSSGETENTTGSNLSLQLKSLMPNFSCNVNIESLEKMNPVKDRRSPTKYRLLACFLLHFT